MKGKYVVTVLALFATALLIVPTAARAGTNLGMQMSADSSTVTICDNNVNYSGCTGNASDVNPASGQITYIGGVGSHWTSNVTSGFGPPFEQYAPFLDISTFDASTGGGGSALTVLLSVSNVTSLTGLYEVINHIGGTNSASGTTVTTQAFLSTTTTFCGSTLCGTALTPLLSLTGASYSGSTNQANLFPGGPYSVTLAITIDSHGLADTTSFDNELDIPEPATLSVLGASLLGLGTGIRRKLTKA